MQRFTLIAGIFFAFIFCVWLARLVLGIPVRVYDIDVPVWTSVFPVIVSGSFAIWAFRLLGSAGGRPA